MKTIFIPLFQGVAAKNILRTDIYKKLLEQNDLRIVLFLNNPHKLEYYKREFHHPNLIYEVVEKYETPSFNRLFNFLKFNLIKTETTKLRRKMELEVNRNYLKYYAKRVFIEVFAKKIFRQITRFLYYHIVKDDNFIEYYLKYKPDLVLLAHLFGNRETSLLRQAKKRGIGTVGLINSWDKITARSAILLLPQKLIVHNYIIKNEAMDFVDMPEKNIFVSGIPHYDYYTNEKRYSYGELCAKIGADPAKRIILYCPIGRHYTDSDSEILRLLDGIVEQGLIPKDIQILVRFPPNDDVEIEKSFHSKNLIFDRPGIRFSAKRGIDWDMNFDDLERLASALYHCSMIVCYTSSMSIDAAAFNKPIINIDFAVKDSKLFSKNPVHYYKWTHYKKLLSSGGIRRVKNKKELAQWINFYLRDPKLDTEGRERIVQDQCWKLDGRAGERVAHYLLNLLHSLPLP